ncbi:hypothetical protein QYM36_015105 [Artemia franciscana]|uniref:Uncharacterized protein n=1 Tax=Artemia franciscana TaxID=6661 RepID=A0AA88HE78_ARTSF|nr:hypothetical protein QYM36_015105 [Artemia franciscana]
MPAPGPTLNAPEPTLNAPELTSPAPVLTSPAPVLTSPAPVLTSPAPVLTSPAPVLTSPAPVLTSPAPVLTSPAPEPTLTAPRLTMPAPGLTLTAPGTHPASLIAPEDDSRKPSITLAVSKDVKGKKPRNFFTICRFCHRSFYKLDKHFLAKKGSCSKNPNGEYWSAKEAKDLHELAKDEVAERLQNKSYFLASQVSSLMEENKTLHSFCKALSAMTGIYFDPLNLPDRTFSFDDSRPVTVPAPTPATPEAPQSAPAREETCECCDYGVKPGDFNKGHDMSFILSERARKRRRDVLMAYTTEEMPKEVSGASSESSEISAGHAKTKNKRRRKGRRTKKTGC